MRAPPGSVCLLRYAVSTEAGVGPWSEWVVGVAGVESPEEVEARERTAAAAAEARARAALEAAYVAADAEARVLREKAAAAAVVAAAMEGGGGGGAGADAADAAQSAAAPLQKVSRVLAEKRKKEGAGMGTAAPTAYAYVGAVIVALFAFLMYLVVSDWAEGLPPEAPIFP
jgi:hypothetical protein